MFDKSRAPENTMPPKKVQEILQPTPQQIAKIDENQAIREYFDNWKSSLRITKDTKRDPPNMKSFARAASEDPRVAKNEEAVYAQFKRAQKNSDDVIGIMGRPTKGLDNLQLHAFARKASENVWPCFQFHFIFEVHSLLQSLASKSCLSKNSLAIFDKFAANAKGDPRKQPLSGASLEELCRKLKECEPWLTSTKVSNI